MRAQTLLSEIVRKDVTPDASTPLNEVDGWDSLRGVRLILRLEEILDRQLSEDEIAGLQTAGSVDALLRTRSTA